MCSILKYFYRFLLLVTTVSAGTQIRSCDELTETHDIEQALNDVEDVAKVAAEAVISGKINGKEDVFSSAFDPLFTPGDKIVLSLIFTELSTIRTGPLRVRIFCREDHIVLSKPNPKRVWLDTGFENHGTPPDGLWPQRMYVPVSSRITAKPGERGSYTSIGYKHDDGFDTSGEAHIFIAPKRLHPPSNDRYDLRRYQDVVKDGLDGRHFILGEIKPLAQTVFHELTHAVGGLILPDPNDPNDKRKRRLKIDDGPKDNTYGWRKCNERKVQNLSNIGIADCITFLAQAIYLQIQGKDTHWTLGKIDPDTLRPPHDLES